MSEVREIRPKDTSINDKQLIVGLIPCQNRYFLDIIWPVIKPGLDSLCEQSMGELTAYEVWRDVFHGKQHLYLLYSDDSGMPVDEFRFQEVFLDKMKSPRKGFVAFGLMSFLPHTALITIAHIEPEYRGTVVFQKAYDFLEREAKKMNAPYLSAATPYPPLEEKLKKAGYTAVYTVYRKKL